MRNFTLACIILLCLAGFPVQAQSAGQANLLRHDISEFPMVGVYLDASQADGTFLSGLSPNQITLSEDDQTVEIAQLLEEHPGVEVIVAVNPAPAMAIRDSRGTSRYEHILAALQTWTEASPGAEADRYTLLTNGIQPARGLLSRQELAGALSKYQPDLKRVKPGLESLAEAVNISLTPPTAPGTDRFILYITPPPEDEQLTALGSLRAQAEQSGARVYVWMISSTTLFDSPGAGELASLAAATGGQLFAYSGVEDIPDLNPALDGLGRIYALKYKSVIRSGESHTLAAEIDLDGEVIRTADLAFDLEILPPNPMFISPPASLERSAPKESEKPLEELSPARYTLQTLVEFPDGRSRALLYARLYVDGSLVVELEEAPFDTFTWDLSSYTASGPHMLRLEVEDVYGLEGSSLEIPVDVAVVIPELSLWEQITRPKTLASIGAFALAGLILGLVLFLAGRRRKQPGDGRRADRDPLTQPVHIQKEPHGREGSLPWRRASNPGVGAVLIPLGEDNEPTNAPAIPLVGNEITFGRDASQAAFVLDSPTVENLHARLRCTGGSYVLADNGSVAGTWVNYAPISREGLRLEHGDIIHFGRLAYRFLLSQPGQTRQPVVRVYNGPQ